MDDAIRIGDARLEDLPAITAIYNDVIATTTAVYQERPVSPADREAWRADRLARGFPVLAAWRGDACVGFGSFGEFRAWPCYVHTVEHSVHVRADLRGQGVGRRLVEALLARAEALDKHVMVAGVDAENAASLRLHRRLGFEDVGVFRQVGRKFDRWLDLAFLQKRIGPPDG